MRDSVIEITAKKPSECSKAELQDFASLVRAGGEVTDVGLEARIKKAETLLFLVHDGCLKGIAAVKNPAKSHRESVFDKAQATIAASLFSFEIGWVFVVPSSRGVGFSHKLVNAAVSITNGRAVFATSRDDNPAMHKILKAHGFYCHGEAYASTSGEHKLVLFIRNVARQGALENE